MRLSETGNGSRAAVAGVIGDGEVLPAEIPGSVYGVLLKEGRIPDPYYRDNELSALKLMDYDYEFSVSFNGSEIEGIKASKRTILRFDGIDTLADIYLNGVLLGSAYNMHRIWEFDIAGILKDEENTLKVVLHSPTKYIKEENKKVYTGGSHECMEGFPHLRKAHCMFGWDWGPRLPDAGIFRDVSVITETEAVLDDIYIVQKHVREALTDGSGPEYAVKEVELDVRCTVRGNLPDTDVQIAALVEAPDGKEIEAVRKNVRVAGTMSTEHLSITVPEPELWWPNGYGSQSLYTVKISLFNADNGELLDVSEKRIGLRTMTVNTDKDEWGECFAHEVNKVKLFAMGADYIPEDNLLSRVTPERTRELLEAAAAANHNCIRVWGGGYYPDDFFFDICDELGLVVWQDFMFACASYELDDDFDANIRAELRDNIKRIRHHASLGLWCGNNEMETQTLDKCWEPSIKQIADYIKIFEYIIPQVVKEEDPETFYWPSSPSSGGSFDNPWDENRGDMHYWDVWHGNKPFTDYRKYFFRYLSEFGFQSFPDMKTIESFTLPEERNVFSRVMEMHQRNIAANGKIVNYISATYLYPESLERFVYFSQLLQAEAIRYGVEHFRRYRGRCMGTVVWQLNDIWPVASWAGIDYFGNWKALQYAEKKMFAPVLLSCEECGELDQRPFCIEEPHEIEKSIRLNVSNETFKEIKGTVFWELRNSSGEILRTGSEGVSVPALSSAWCDKVIFEDADELENYVSYYFAPEGTEAETAAESASTCLFTAPKHYRFKKPSLDVKREGDELIIATDCYTKNIGITSSAGKLLLSDNYFDMNPGIRRVKLLEGKDLELKIMCVNSTEVITI